jgi:cell wall-associated NlpC family hydrolase
MLECVELRDERFTSAPDPKTIREAPSITGKPGGIGRRLILIFLVFAFTGLVLGQVAWAEPTAITKAKSEAEALQERVDELSEQLDAAVEDYNYAKAKVKETKEAAERTQALLTKAEADLEVANAHLTERLVEIYKEGHLGVIDALAVSGSFSELIDRIDLLKRVGEQDAQVVADIQAYREEVAARKIELARQIEDERALAAEAEVAKVKVEEQLAANEKALAGKEAQIAQLEKEEAARQAKLAAEAKKRAEEAARKAKLAAAERARQRAASLNASQGVRVWVPDSASSSDVVSNAMKYLGCPYVWAGESPKGFDCSGFVMYVYKQVGVSLPHSSRLQYGCGKAVSRGELQPGDLVFFHNPISHVGIYIGDGQMIHAAGTGKGVRIGDVGARDDYYGACRIIL